MNWDRRTLVASLALGPLGLQACARGSGDGLAMWAMGAEAAKLPELIASLPRGTAAPRVTVQPLPWTAAHEKLLTGYAGNSLPDLGQIGNSWLAELAAIGAIEPVPKRYETLLADQFPAVVETNRIGGRLWAIPWYVDTRVQFYRSDLFARAGYGAPPPRWDDWKAALHKVKAVAGPGNYAILMPLNEYEHLTTLALSAGAGLLSEDGGRGDFSAPEFREALGFYKSLFDEGLAPVASNTQISNVWNEFARGFFSIYPSGPWTIGDMKSRLPAAMQDNWATAPNPGPDGPGAAAPGGSSLVVYRRGTRPEAAWDLIAHLLDPRAQLAFQRLTGDLPAVRSVWSAAGLSSDPIVAAFAAQLERARALPKVAEWERVVSEMQIVAERMVRGQFTVVEAATEMDKRADKLLAKRRWMIEQGRAL
jgi:multiple sugar transport system substrate-binding protein